MAQGNFHSIVAFVTSAQSYYHKNDIFEFTFSNRFNELLFDQFKLFPVSQCYVIELIKIVSIYSILNYCYGNQQRISLYII